MTEIRTRYCRLPGLQGHKAAPAATASLQGPAEALSVSQEARQLAEGLTPCQLIEELVVASAGREEAERLIVDLRDDIAELDAALSQHEAAVEQWSSGAVQPAPVRCLAEPAPDLSGVVRHHSNPSVL